MALTLGFIGAGNVGGAIAKLAVSHQLKVVMSNSRGPETLSALVAQLGPNAKAGTVDEAVKADIIVVGVPFSAFTKLPVDKLAGKVVLDTNNYYKLRDGAFPELDNGTTTSSEMLQAHLKGAKIVKGFNNLAYFQMLSNAKPKSDPNRAALPIAGDDAQAKKVVADLFDTLGFDALDMGALNQGKYTQPTSFVSALVANYLPSWFTTTTLGYMPVYLVAHTSVGLKAALEGMGWKAPK